MAKGYVKIVWKNLWCLLMLCFISSNLADDHEHIHIKVHLPEIIKKHTHMRTVVKHHFRPKKSNKIHHHYADESSSSASVLDPSFITLPQLPRYHHNPSYLHSHHIDSPSVWDFKPKLVDVKIRKPLSPSPQLSSDLLTHHHQLKSAVSPALDNWDWENDLSSASLKINKPNLYFKTKFNGFTNHLPTNYDLHSLNDFNTKFQNHDLNRYEDDEEDFLMGEDVSYNHPSMKLKFPSTNHNYYHELPNRFVDHHWIKSSAQSSIADSLESESSTFHELSSENDGGTDVISEDIRWNNNPAVMPLSSPIDQTAWETVNNGYRFPNNEQFLNSGTEYEKYAPSKLRFDPSLNMHKFHNYNYRISPQKQWKKIKRNKSQRSNPSSFRIRL